MSTKSRKGEGAEDSIQQFWDDWRARRRASDVTIETVANRANTNKTALYELGKSGKKCYPGENFVDSLFTVINVPIDEREVQLERYRHLETASQNPAPESLPSWRRLWLTAAAVSVVVASLSVLVTALVMRPTPHAATSYAAIKVQNMVALGESDLRPDLTPIYLSSQRKPRCAANGCKVAGTDMDSGALLVATCQAEGAELVNFNLDSTSWENPHRARSARWYTVRLPDGREGHINEVYIDPLDRGGLGLPTCE